MKKDAIPVLMCGEIIGDYELLRLLSHHNDTEVWVCAARSDGTLHVLKRVDLDHPRIATYKKLYEKLQTVRCPFLRLPENRLESMTFGFCIVYPFCPSGTLKDFLKGTERLPLGQTVHLLKCTLMALSALHQAGIVHRDVKPANIYISDGGDPQLSDFGIAKFKANRNTEGRFVGSAAYMSPEQALDSNSAGPESDIFSLGSVLYEVVTGKARYPGNDFKDTLAKVVSDHSEPPFDEMLQYVPDSLAYLLCTMMHCDRRNRADHASDLLKDLEKLHLPENQLLREGQ